MMSRHEDEERARKERLMLELEWDEQKKLEEQLRQARQRQKQAEIWESYKAKDAKQVRSRTLRHCYYGYQTLPYSVVCSGFGRSFVGLRPKTTHPAASEKTNL